MPNYGNRDLGSSTRKRRFYEIVTVRKQKDLARTIDPEENTKKESELAAETQILAVYSMFR